MKLIKVLTIAALLCLSTFTGTAQTTGAGNKRSAATHRRHRHKAKRIVPVCPPSLSTTTPSGLTYVITHHGAGRQPLSGETVIVNYTGLLTNGTMFDSSYNRAQPFRFELGKGRVIKGWDEGVSYLHVGDQATFFIPPALGYGERGIGPIPPNADMIFVIELVGIQEKPAAN